MDAVQAIFERLEEREHRLRLARARARPVHTPRALRAAMDGPLAPVLAQAGPSVATLAARWEEIVGARLARASEPAELVRGRKHATLVVRAPSAASGIIEHARSHILERVSLAVGQTVGELRIIHTAAPRRPASDAAAAPRPRLLSPEEKTRIADQLGEVQSNPVREALRQLGEAIHARR